MSQSGPRGACSFFDPVLMLAGFTFGVLRRVQGALGGGRREQGQSRHRALRRVWGAKSLNTQSSDSWETEGGSVDVIQQDVLARIIRRSMFWTPERLAPSTWIEHVPFAFWLVDVLRSRTIVELGTHNGVSYSAMCQPRKLLGWQHRALPSAHGKETSKTLSTWL